MKKILNKKGFTLIEMLIAMTIFSIFIGVLISSYSSIVVSQRDANEYRKMYVVARQVFDGLVGELRDNVIDYSVLPTGNEKLKLLSKDGKTVTTVVYEDNIVKLLKNGGSELKLNDGKVKVTEFDVYLSPNVNPYDQVNVAKTEVQFQPKVTIFAHFEYKFKESADPYSMDLQTTISSRAYN